ncbi:MAG: heat-inducible transcriptional repressor HrcA [Rickettsiales bacterium]|nr:heat-inducible transcriptional repressor HrcA [Rickettsiales bacterium]
MIQELNNRSQEILRLVVKSYLDTGHATGSKSLAQTLEEQISSATIRNVLADLEDLGLLYAPHRSAGRLPTNLGLRLFVDSLIEKTELSHDDKENIETALTSNDTVLNRKLEKITEVISGLSDCASIVVAPKVDKTLKQIEFVPIGDNRVLAVLVSNNNVVENRIFEVPADFSISSLQQAANYLNSLLGGNTLSQVKQKLARDIETRQTQLDELSNKIIEKGIAVWSQADGGHLIVKGQSKLLNDISAIEDLDHVRELFNVLETQKNLVNLLDYTHDADGVKILIGAENNLFNLTGCSMIVAPYKSAENEIIGALGVIGPKRLNYSRIIPVVDYTSQILSQLIR